MYEDSLAPFGVALPAGEGFASAESPWLNRPELFLVPKELPQPTSAPPAMEKKWQPRRGSPGPDPALTRPVR